VLLYVFHALFYALLYVFDALVYALLHAGDDASSLGMAMGMRSR
jgi:hypothetical protein